MEKCRTRLADGILDINVMATSWAARSSVRALTERGGGYLLEPLPRRLVCLIKVACAPYAADETCLPFAVAEWWHVPRGERDQVSGVVYVRKRFAANDPFATKTLWPPLDGLLKPNLVGRACLVKHPQRDIFFVLPATLRCWKYIAAKKTGKLVVRPLIGGMRHSCKPDVMADRRTRRESS